MALDEPHVITEGNRCRRGADDLKENIYADGKVGAINEAGAGFFDEFSDLAKILIPAGRSDDEIYSCPRTRTDVFDDCQRSSEVDSYINAKFSKVLGR